MGKTSWAQQTYQGYHVSLDFLLFFLIGVISLNLCLSQVKSQIEAESQKKQGKLEHIFFCTGITIDFKMPRDQVPLVLGCFASHTQ